MTRSLRLDRTRKTMRNRNRRWIHFWFLIPILQLVSADETRNSSKTGETTDTPEKNNRGLFSPRMDYDQWKPLGRGDPLQNDPTYDYVPPVLERVHYWVDPALRKPDSSISSENQKTEILLLGITSKKPANSSPHADSRKDIYDPYLKYVEESKSNLNPNQRIARPSFIPPVASSFFPSFHPPTKKQFPVKNGFSKEIDQRVPYTVLMPPPVPLDYLPKSPETIVTQTPLTLLNTTPTTPSKSSSSSSVTVQAANLIYHSSSLSDQSEWKNKHYTIDPSVAWEQELHTTENPYSNFRDALVYNTNLSPPESYMHAEFAPRNYTNTTHTLVAAESQNINFVTPPPLAHAATEEIMFKGQVADDNIDISNTYVKIGKPEAEVHSTALGMDGLPIISHDLVMFPHGMSEEARLPPLTVEKLQDMQTMHPPPVTQSPVYPKVTSSITKVLQEERLKPLLFRYSPTESALETTTPGTPINVNNSLDGETTEKQSTISSSPASSTASPTTVATLTTDPLFKHYKQPVEPLKGPLYLIIQGHSKVKTYGPTKQVHGISIQETNEISDVDDGQFKVKHLHGFHKDTILDDMPRMARSGNIQTLKHVVQTGFGAIDLSGLEEMERRVDDDFHEAEMQVGYKVGDKRDFSEEYHKGIVEEARKLRV
ncbi:uncharacterized protein isoform X1 [Leptinotarsa decemlineata]|uniref:uncharacterized protein isoform X1 n=2 Tax=Leptinotarsa decemlineata TaxID=7539 RepID=UPI003D30A26A